MPSKKLSDRQKNILKYIEAYVDERGYPPSIREIGDRVGISSTSVVDYNLRVLERDGYLRRDREVSRGLELTSTSRGQRQTQPRVVRIPVVGRIAAGVPIDEPCNTRSASRTLRSVWPTVCGAWARASRRHSGTDWPRSAILST